MSNTVDTLEQGRVVVEKERSGKELVTKVNGGEPPRETGPTANGTHVVRIASQAEFDKAHIAKPPRSMQGCFVG
jgi:hypothetical protein